MIAERDWLAVIYRRPGREKMRFCVPATYWRSSCCRLHCDRSRFAGLGIRRPYRERQGECGHRSDQIHCFHRIFRRVNMWARNVMDGRVG